MIVNGKSVRGIFLYDPTLEYENGDFVIYESKLFVCKPSGSTTVMGSEPGEDRSNFVPYPGEMASSKDYKEYVTNKDQVKDKYLSSTGFYDIVQNLCFGLGSTGIIWKRSHMGSDYEGEEDSIDSMIKSPDYNNGIVLVDRDEAQDVIPEIYLSGMEEPWNTVIVRQHSYSFNGGDVMRIQELIDVYTSTMMVRCHVLGSDFISDWSSMNECDRTLALKYKRLRNWYQNKARYDMTVSQVPTDNSFKFKSIREGFYSNYSNKTLAIGEDGISKIYSNTGLLVKDDIDYYKSGVYNGTFMVTLIISQDNSFGSSALSNYSLSIDLFKDLSQISGTTAYNLTDSLQVSIEISEYTGLNSSNLTINLPYGYHLVDAYCRIYGNIN